MEPLGWIVELHKKVSILPSLNSLENSLEPFPPFVIHFLVKLFISLHGY